MKLQKLCGYYCFAYLLTVVFFNVITPILGFKPPNAIIEIIDPAEAMKIFKYPLFLQTLMKTWSISSSIFFVVFAMALRERMHSKAPNLMNFAVIAAVLAALGQLFGSMIVHSLIVTMIEFQDPSVFIIARDIMAGVSNAGLHGCGWMFLLTGISAIRTQMLPKILGYLIFIVGFGYVLVLAIKQVGILLMLLLIVYIIENIALIWLGIYLIRNPDPIIE